MDNYGSDPVVLIDHPIPSVVRITLNRPKSLNALNALNAPLLSSFVEALRANASVRIIILEGQGDRSFCAGEDLKQSLAPKTGSAEELQDITRLTSSSQSIVIAAVQGFAIGGGAEIALAADFVIRGPGAKFRFPEISLGHAVAGGITLRLPHMVGLLKAKELLLTGRWVDADEALKLGLLTEISHDPKVMMPDVAKGDIRDLNAALSSPVANYPERSFFRFGGQDVTFQQFDTAVGALAGGLRKAGIAPGDRVLVMVKNSVEMAYSWMAVNRLGAIWVPINPELKSVTLKGVITSAQPKLAIVDEALLPEFQQTHVVDDASVFVNIPDGTGPRSLSNFMGLAPPVTEPVIVTPATTSALLYTSGTTGKSKACVLSHEYFLLQTKALIESCGLRDSDVLYCPFPLFHFDATALTMVPAFLLGAVAALSARFSASRFWDEIRATEATAYNYMGATLAITYKQQPNEETVTTTFVLLGVYLCRTSRKRYQIRIINEGGDKVPANTPGHLLIRSDHPNAMLKEYFADPAYTASAFKNLWLHTGDLVKVDEHGNMYFVGRDKDVVRRRGENVNAKEVEDEFFCHPDVVVAAVYSVPSQLGPGTEEDLKLAVQLHPGSTVTEEELWQWSVTRVARFQVQSLIEIVQDIKRTPTGKLDKIAIPLVGG
ncbi:long-chain-fatty-acid ligase [Fusarium phyllophilum]|uniref:Long-chain-fatty-acid ligase n=1 Tax=Fusarium phyllophilum TaxID=47803 RepID=A0A8H5KAF0_9HYPO|nr:long-chain-fatty-acid ligase [Fusarium phyllophilum]